MSSRASAARYARALLDVAIKESDPGGLGTELAAFADLVAGNPGPAATRSTNPGSAAAAKRTVVRRAARPGCRTPARSRKLLLMLAERDRLALLPDLLDVYRERLREHQQVVQAEVTTAMPLGSRRRPMRCASVCSRRPAARHDDDQGGSGAHRRHRRPDRQHGLRRQRRHAA